MEDYEAEGGVVETVTNPDGTTSQSMKMEQTVQSTVSNNGAKIPADPKTWIGFAIQQGVMLATMNGNCCSCNSWHAVPESPNETQWRL